MTNDNTNPAKPQKEPFDYERFARMYPNSNGTTRLCNCITDTDRKNYTELYYKLDEVSTIEEFARLLDYWDETS